MKLLLLSIFTCFAFGAFAQMPKKETAEIKTPEATCAECKPIIENSIKDQVDGLIKINVVITRGVTLVSWYPDRTNIGQIKTAIANAGFDADDVTANDDDYNKLPICCKKVKDGGGKQPKKKPGS